MEKESESLRRLITLRGAQRGIVTKTINNINKLMDTEETNEENLLSTIEFLKAKMKKLEKLNEDIWSSIEEDQLEEDSIEGSKVDFNICTIINKCQLYLSNNVNSTKMLTSGIKTLNIGKTKLNIPKLNMPKFSGDVTLWRQFFETFNTVIDANESLSDVEKLLYLKNHLQDSALKTIDNLTLNSENYRKAIRLLTEKYDNRALIVTKHMEKLLKLPDNVCTSDINKLRHFYDCLVAEIECLETIGMSSDQYESLLIPMLLQKFSPELRYILCREIHSDNFTLPLIVANLKTEVLARERSRDNIIDNNRNQHSPFYLEKTTTKKPFIIEKNPNYEALCAYCNKDHYSNDCTSVIDVISRKNILKDNNRCFNCLGTNHTYNKCYKQNVCRICSKKHHTSICDEKIKTAVETKHNVCTSVLNSEHNHVTILQTAKTYVSKDSESVSFPCRILFDNGAQKSFITKTLAKSLEIKSTRSISLKIGVFGSMNSNVIQYPVYEVFLHTNNGLQSIELLGVEDICAPINNSVNESILKNDESFRNITFADKYDSKLKPIDILLGLNKYWKFMCFHTINNGNGLFATETRFGYVLSGVSNNDNTDNVTINTILENCDNKLFEYIESLSKIENVNMSDNCEVYEHFSNTIVFKNQRYVVSLPWQENSQYLTDHYDLCYRRLKSLLYRLSKLSLLEKYDSIIKNYIDTGVLETVDPSENTGPIVHYLPHHHVLKLDSKTTPLRIVVDGSAHIKNDLSINNCLFTGPNLLQQSCSILIHFRMGIIGVCADIEKAFLQILVDQQDCDALRIIWPRDLKKLNFKEPDCIILRFVRLVFGLNCSPFILNSVVQKHLLANERKLNGVVVCTGQVSACSNDLKPYFYSDNFISSFNCLSSAKEFSVSLKNIMQEAGMNLRGWSTNDSELQKILNSDISETQVKILGIPWDTLEDVFVYDCFHHATVCEGEFYCKRKVLSTLATFFDPLGYFTPVSIALKLLLKNIWSQGFDWDTELSAPLKIEFINILNTMKDIGQFKISRAFFKNINYDTAKYTIHIFTDASSQAYATCAYLKCDDITKPAKLIMSKSKIAPNSKTMTIPKLELLGALLGARLSRYLQTIFQQYQIEKYFYWCDSQCVIAWINDISKAQNNVFIKNRIIEIRKLTDLSCWQYCETKSNPADYSTRSDGISAKIFSRQWWEGPEFLNLQPSVVSIVNINSASINDTAQVRINLFDIFDVKKYSRFRELIRISGYVLMFIDKCKRINNSSMYESCKKAKTLWFLSSQLQNFPEELEILSTKTDNYTCNIRRFGLFLDNNGIMRCETRISLSEYEYDFIKPIFLSHACRLVVLLVTDIHENRLHSGLKDTLVHVREQFYVTSLRRLIRTVISNCCICKRFNKSTYEIPSVAPLPNYRTSVKRAFLSVGLDFAGPFYVFDVFSANKIISKSYLAIFTCASSRGVHLELVKSMKMPDFMRAFKRFVSRRGPPQLIVSDNALTFKSAVSEVQNFINMLKNATDSDDLCQWKFNVPLAPWHGGFWERLIKSVKSALKRIVGNLTLRYDELETVMIEIEYILNTRPLTYIYLDENSRILTPMHLMFGDSMTGQSTNMSDFGKPHISEPQSLFRYRMIKTAVDHYWQRWVKEYLIELSEHHMPTGTSGPCPNVGDIVILKDKALPRIQWNLAKVIKIFKGRDEKIRSVELLTTHGKCGAIKRAITQIIPLELSSVSEDVGQAH